MHYVQLDLNHDNFYCPATGFHMLSAEHYEASPATLFVYPEDAGEFEWYSKELEKLEATINAEAVGGRFKSDGGGSQPSRESTCNILAGESIPPPTHGEKLWLFINGKI